MPEGVITIDDYAFSGCTSLKTVILPVSLKYVYEDIFEDCTALETVYYKGTKEQWDAIRWNDRGDCLKNAKIECNYKN